jgi:hypothetical protein
MEYTALAQFTMKIWWWPSILLLATAWLWRQTLRKHRGAEGLLKVAVMLNAAMTGYLYFSGSLSSGLSVWLNLSYPWSNIANQTVVFLFFLFSLIWLLDSVLGRTALSLPRKAWVAVMVIVFCTMGFLFPILEWIAGNHFPRAQSFGLGGAPLLIFSGALLGGSRPNTWLGQGMLIIAWALSLDAALVVFYSQPQWHYLLPLLVNTMALVYTLFKSRMVALS